MPMRIGIITDIHENVKILQKTLEAASHNKCDEMVCLGDITGFDKRFYRYNYTRSASACIKLIKENCRWIVAGNHDLFFAGRIPSWTDGFKFPEGWFMMDHSERKFKAAGRFWSYEGDAETDISGEDIDFLTSLPEFIITDVPGIKCLFSHYIFPDITGSTTRYAEKGRHLNGHWNFMDSHEVLFSFSGHTHNHFTGFAYRKTGSLFKAFHNLPNDSFFLGNEKTIIALPPLSGEKGRTGFSVFDSELKQLSVIHFVQSD